MRILALETATRRATIALVDGKDLVTTRIHEDPLTHAERVVVLIDELMAEAGFAPSSLDAIACGIGPGSFTGVRIALSTAKGIALALDLPIIGVGSLAAMASALSEKGAGVIPLLDARKGEVFAAVFAADGSEEVAPAHLPRAALGEFIEPHLAAGKIIVGEVAEELDIPRSSIRRGFSLDLPDASVVARLAMIRAKSGDFDDLHTLEPIYVRPPDIRKQLSPSRSPSP